MLANALLMIGFLVVAILPRMACGQGGDPASTQGGQAAFDGLFLFDPTEQPTESIPLVGSAGDTTAAIVPHRLEVPIYAPQSPVQLFGLINRQNPANTISDDELTLLSERYAVVSGLDGHGYDFPGAIERFRAVNTVMPALCRVDAMAIQMVGDRFSELDVDENAFFHSADPASLRVLVHDGGTLVWFKQDARAFARSGLYRARGVRRYIVETADVKEGPYSLLSSSLLEDGSSHYSHLEPTADTSRFYRIRTQLSDRSVVAYSNPVQPDAAATSIGIASMSLNGDFSVTCYGVDCPADAQDVILHVDLNNNRVFDDGNCTLAEGETIPPDTCEREAATDRIVQDDGGVTYTGRVDRPTHKTFYAFRATLASLPTIVAPLEGRSYQVAGINNRLQMPAFGSLLVDPNYPIWRDRLEDRLLDCLDHGYTGMHLDFAFDSIDRPWIASGQAVDSEQSRVDAIPAAVNSMLDRLKTTAPNATIIFNGYFVGAEPEQYFNSYLASADGADFEFFAFGFDKGATEIHRSTPEAATRILELNSQGKWAIALSRIDEANIVARLKALVLYLLIAGDHVYYFCETDQTGQDIPYFPEWDVPLGRPLAAVNAISALRDFSAERLYTRVFENGRVYYNSGDRPIEIELSKTRNQLSVTGGMDPVAGGDGEAHYTPITVLNIEPNDVAIVVRFLP